MTKRRKHKDKQDNRGENLPPATETNSGDSPSSSVKSKGGRKRALTIDAELLNKIETYAAQGMTKEQISDCLDISSRTLLEYEKRDSSVTSAIKKGKSKGIAIATNYLMQCIQERNLTAMIFYLKCNAGWKETQVFQHETPQPLIIQTINTETNGSNTGADKDNDKTETN